MPCYCGGCRDCLEARGLFDVPEHCVVCGVPLDEDNETGFCSESCEKQHRADTDAWADAYALQLQEERTIVELVKKGGLL